MIRMVGIKKKGLAGRIRIELYSCPNYVSPMSTISNNGHIYFICMYAWIVTHIYYMYNIVYARTRIIVFSMPMKYLTLDKVWV